MNNSYKKFSKCTKSLNHYNTQNKMQDKLFSKKELEIKNFFPIERNPQNNFGQSSNNFHFNINYNNSTNYYEEISKAFNFITFILKRKDSQIKELKIKIKELERQLNDINETNIMTFNNKDINEIGSSEENQNFSYSNKNNLKKIGYNYIPNKTSIFFSNVNKNNNIIINNDTNNNKMPNYNSTNINIINRVKNSTNINKINNYRHKIDLNGPKLTNNKSSNTYMNSIPINNKNKNMNLELEENKKIDMNKNTNEYSNEKKNINIIRKEPYHINANIKYRNGSGNKIRNFQTNETDTSTGNDKIKIFNLSTMGRANSKNSKSTSITLSDEGISKSKAEIKNYLKEIKYKIDHDKFKKFVELIKILVKNKNTEQKNQIIFEIKRILVDKNLIDKFENILKIK